MILRVDMYSHVSKDGKLRRKLEWYATWKPGNKYAKLHVPEKMKNTAFYKLITEKGVVGPDPVGSKGSVMSWYTLADGKAFMESLQYEFKGGYGSAGPPYETKNGEYIKFPKRPSNVEMVTAGTNLKKAEREKKRLQDAGYSVGIRASRNFPQEYTVIGVKVGKKK